VGAKIDILEDIDLLMMVALILTSNNERGATYRTAFKFIK